ncbi:hypothetical protein ACFL2H_07185 [Planctomycetota bacterium]
MKKRQRTFIAVTVLCVAAAVIGGWVGIQHWLIVVAFLAVSAIVVGDLVVVEFYRNRLSESETLKSNLLLLPFWTFFLYGYVFLMPWTRLPLEFDSFMQLAPGDPPVGAILRLIICSTGWVIAIERAKQIIWTKDEIESARQK